MSENKWLAVDGDIGMRVERYAVWFSLGGEAVSVFLCVSGLLDMLKEVFVLLPETNTQKDYERMFQIQLAHKWSSLETSADGLSTSSRSIQSSWELNYSQRCRKWSVVWMGKQACLLFDDEFIYLAKTPPRIEPYTLQA